MVITNAFEYILKLQWNCINWTSLVEEYVHLWDIVWNTDMTTLHNNHIVFHILNQNPDFLI